MTSPPEPRKVAIVTGASRGIGAGIAAGFLGLGYRVVAASLSIPLSHAVDVHTVQGDISQVETAQRIVEETLDRFGRIDTLVNNAGIFIGKPFLDYTEGVIYLEQATFVTGETLHIDGGQAAGH